MATYAIGDLQGCFATFERLLARVDFSPTRDRLWLVGDLVNRGPRNLEVLRYVEQLGDRATVVLGNHDLHLLARADGRVPAKRRDTLDDVLGAPDRYRLIAWLRRRPLLHHEAPYLLVHAGLHPSWTVDQAVERARALEGVLRTANWREQIGAAPTLAEDLGVLTRIRTVRDDGTLCDHDGPPAEAPAGCVPWFAHPRRRSREVTVLFGHWSALGLYVSKDAIGLDTGCVWGRSLTALRLEDQQIFSRTGR